MSENYILLFQLAVLVVVILITIWKRKENIGNRWKEPGGRKLAIKDKELHCTHCGCQNFQKIEGLVNTSLIMLFQLGFWNRSAACYKCVDCGFIHWFMSPEEKVFAEFDKDEI